MGFLDSLFGWGGEDPVAIRQREEGYRQQEAARQAAALEAQRQAAAEQAAREAQQQQAQLDYLERIRQDNLAKEAEARAKDPTATRQAATGVVSQAFAPEFETTALPGSLTDPYEESAYQSGYKSAQDYIDRLFGRGIITETGKSAAEQSLADQGARARVQLNDLSDAILAAEREKVGGFRNRALERAQGLNVNEGFDITPYTTGYNTELANFSSGLGDLYKSQVPSTLFDTSNLANIAGAAQGAGNRPFEPDIQPVTYSGTSEEGDTDPFTGQKLTQKRTTSVF